ncbi:recombinase family protein [Mahella australiensis]|uniref:Recombinase n=1 Tax=Mahella australiensis (strain DSM 15567 / CIP 107919 / 50-1 BON) TaxID=697281 RepID=F3ZY13_MAHA5|nr:recombinase family protein [Mahella australiensis]AEE97709.1 Recombinase [Mahella australiensis 50-1 BON]
MQYCLYLRKSRADLEAEARGEGETLKRHEQILLELAKKLNLNITKIYREIVSGETIAARPVMQQLLVDVEQGTWDGVLVMEIERLARGDTIDQGIVAQTFKYSNTKIITPMKIYDPNNEFDEEYFEFGLFMSRREYKTINRRLQNGRISSVKEGKYVGSIPPYGYVRKKLQNDKGYTLEPLPAQADIVRLIFELYTKGELQPDGNYKRLGTSLIARKLNDLHIPPAKADIWVTSSIQSILRNPVYAGKIRWDWRRTVKKMTDGQIEKTRPKNGPNEYLLFNGIHEALVDEQTWNLAQKFLSNNPAKPAPKGMPIKNPLASIVVCGFCGRKMVRRPYNNSEQADTLMCYSTACPNVSAPLHLVEERVLQSLEEWLKNYKIKWSTDKNKTAETTQLEIKKSAVNKLNEQIKTLEKQMNSLYDLLEQGVYSTDVFLERSKVINDRLEKAQKDRDALLDDLKLGQKMGEESIAIPKIEKILELYKSTDDPALKNKLLKEVLEKAVYTKTVNGRWHNSPGDFELVLYPKLPR